MRLAYGEQKAGLNNTGLDPQVSNPLLGCLVPKHRRSVSVASSKLAKPAEGFFRSCGLNRKAASPGFLSEDAPNRFAGATGIRKRAHAPAHLA